MDNNLGSGARQTAIKFWLILLPSLLVAGSLWAYSEDIRFGGQKTRGPVDFPHESHMDEADCLECHHRFENGENVLDEDELDIDNPEIYCGACHTKDSSIQRREAFHYQCITCHDELAKAGEPTGPLLCGQCHIRETLSDSDRPENGGDT